MNPGDRLLVERSVKFVTRTSAGRRVGRVTKLPTPLPGLPAAGISEAVGPTGSAAAAPPVCGWPSS